MKLRLLLAPTILALLLLLATGCGSSSPTSPPTSDNSVMALKVGNKWVYRTAWYNDDGSESDVSYDTVSIIGTMSGRGGTWYITNNGPLYANGADGLWEWTIDTSRVEPSLYVPYPVTLNQTFGGEDYVTASDTIHFSYVISSTNTTVTTHAGSFACFQYSSRYRDPRGNPGNGIGFDGDDVNSVAPGLGPLSGEGYKLGSDGRKILRHRWEMYEKELK